MSALTSPDNIVYWTTAPIDPASLVAESAAQATSIQNALLTRQGQTYRWANAAARTAQTGMNFGSRGFQIDTGVEYFYDGTNWVTGVRTNLQQDTTNSVVRTITMVGMGKIIGNGTGRITETVTLPVAFSSIPVINATYIGFRATGAFNPTGLSSSVSIMPNAAVGNQSVSSFDVIIAQGGTLAAANDWYYSWTATGVA